MNYKVNAANSGETDASGMTIATTITAIIVRRRQKRRSFLFGQLNTHMVTHPREAFIVQEGLCKPSAVLGARGDADTGPWRGAIQEGDNISYPNKAKRATEQVGKVYGSRGRLPKAWGGGQVKKR